MEDGVANVSPTFDRAAAIEGIKTSLGCADADVQCWAHSGLGIAAFWGQKRRAWLNRNSALTNEAVSDMLAEIKARYFL